jgi:hypothetical protein
MISIMADADFQGQFERILSCCQSQPWLAFFEDLDVQIKTFRELGFAPETRDDVVFERCQAEGIQLLTANRNHDGEYSLEATLRCNPQSLYPVFTIPDAQRLMNDSRYLNLVTEHLLESLFDFRERPSDFVGLGRIHLPKRV